MEFEYLQEVSEMDKRLTNRMIKTLQTLSVNIQSSIIASVQNVYEAKAIYRMLSNKEFAAEKVMPAVVRETNRKLMECGVKTVLSVQDTTEVEYKTNAKGLGNIGTEPSLKGLLVHSAIAVTTDGIPYGMLYQEIWSRPFEEYGKKHKRKELDISEKESNKWLRCVEKTSGCLDKNIRQIQVCDREGDIFELFKKAEDEKQEYLIRACHNRKTESETYLFESLSQQPEAGEIVINVPRNAQTKTPARKAVLSIKFLRSHINVPKNLKKKYKECQGIEVYAVLAEEKDAPQGVNPISWRLLTNIRVDNFDEAYEKVVWYTHRWKIERFHYVLKSGCGIEKLQNRSAQALSNLIFLYSLISIQILELMYLSRQIPDLPGDVIFDEDEWQILYKVAHKTKKAPQTVPTLKELVWCLAKLGGFAARKSDGEPGLKVIWQGLVKLFFILDSIDFI